jgi:hypothetical protein
MSPSPWSSRINFVPFRIFRGPLFHKPVTGQELFFRCFLRQCSKVDMITLSNVWKTFCCVPQHQRYIVHHFETNEVICFSEHILILGYIMYSTSLNKLKYIYVSCTPWTMDIRRLNIIFFVAQIQIQLPNKYLGVVSTLYLDSLVELTI